MSSMPKAATPGLLSVANLLASIQHNSSMAPAATAREELQATQLLSENDMNMAPTPLKMEKEGDLGTLGFPGGVTRGCPWCCSLREMRRITVLVALDATESICYNGGCVMWRNMNDRMWK
jgi:hypothetical protein